MNTIVKSTFLSILILTSSICSASALEAKNQDCRECHSQKQFYKNPYTDYHSGGWGDICSGCKCQGCDKGKTKEQNVVPQQKIFKNVAAIGIGEGPKVTKMMQKRRHRQAKLAKFIVESVVKSGRDKKDESRNKN